LSSTWTSIPPPGSFPGGKPSSTDAGVQANTPELPAGCKWRQVATSSKFSYSFVDRVTPIGLPEQRTIPPSQVQVSGSPLTGAKSAAPRVIQPGPDPSIMAEGGSSAAVAAATRAAIEKDAVSIRRVIARIISSSSRG